MRHRVALLIAVGVVALAATSSAFAFDCIRVSSSYQGLVASTSNSGHWLLFDMTNPANVQANLSNFAAEPLTSEQATCVSAAYLQTGLTPYFALGFGVAGGLTNGPGVLAHNNPNENVLGNLKGIDHIDASPIGGAIFAAAGGCGVSLEPA
jgi:hypothetical protein